MSTEKEIRESLRKQIGALLKESFALQEGLFRVYFDLRDIYVSPNLAPANTERFTKKLNKSKVEYDDFEGKLTKLEVEVTGLQGGPAAERGLDDELKRLSLMQALRPQRAKAMHLELKLREVANLIEAVKRPKEDRSQP